jgi:hypothetical protein
MYVLGYMKIYVLTVFVAAASDGTGKNMFLEGKKKRLSRIRDGRLKTDSLIETE